MTAFTKQVARHDRVSVDGEDVSNLFSSMNVDNTDADVDVSGFSENGNEETLSGTRTQSLSGNMFFTPEGHAILYKLYKDRTVFAIEYQPDGLADPTREVWSGMVQMRAYPFSGEFGQARAGSVTFKAADETGIVCSAGNT